MGGVRALPNCSGLSAGAGRLLLVPLAYDSLFSNAATGLKNMWANLDHGTDANSTVVAMMYKPKNTLAPALPRVWRKAQIRPSVTLARSERMKRSARMTRSGELPSAVTTARMKNQNQYPPTQVIRPPIHQSRGRMSGVAAAGV